LTALGHRASVAGNVVGAHEGRARAQRVEREAEGHPGWHRHPGIVLATVEEGSVKLYRSDCGAQEYGTGEVIRHTSDQVHLVRNETSAPAVLYATSVKPNPTPPPPNSVDDPAPAGCPVR
jgi:quercetin dioxygenase-like cupin family protein